MEKQNRKFITVAFVILAGVVAIVMGVILDSLAASFGVVARYRAMDIVAHGVPVGSALLTFVLLQFNKKVLEWADGVVLEVRKVVWPTKKDTISTTTVCCVMLLVSGAILGVFDTVSRLVVNYIIIR